MAIRYFNEGFAFKMARPVRIASGVVIALVIVARKAEYPRALLKPWFKGAR